MNIETLKTEVGIEDILEHYGWQETVRLGGWNDWQKTLCPFHDDHDPSASVNIDAGRFVCFTCGVNGDILDIVMDVERLESYKDAKDYIEEVFFS